MKREILRRCIFRPWRKGQGPVYTLEVWETGRTDRRGQPILAYRLHERDYLCSHVLFEGSDFSPSPMDAIDSNATIASLMGFLTLQPGDTDQEYFANYTPAQLRFAQSQAEYLGAEVSARFGE